tara:strand:+ start:1753 stop:2133 length:381 start_codon:yes stop_codon:yes gene_type:complete
MAGLLYLPRIFVYHVENLEKKEVTNIFKTMEKKLYNYIMMPAMILSWIFGFLLINSIGIQSFAQTWLQIKFLLVFFLTTYHFYLGKCLVDLSQDKINKTSKFFRIINEIPTILLIIIIFIVIFKPI